MDDERYRLSFEKEKAIIIEDSKKEIASMISDMSESKKVLEKMLNMVNERFDDGSRLT